MGKGWPKIILFGDSLTQWSFDVGGGHWGATITNKLQRCCDVVCRGFSGYNSQSAKIMLPSLIDRESAVNIEAVTIFFGANDACFEDSPTKQNVPLDEYKSNLKEMVNYLMMIGVEKHKVILISPTAYSFELHKGTCDIIPKRSEENVKLYANGCIDVAKGVGVPFLDIYNDMMMQKDWKRFLSDGLHLTPEGGTFLADQLWPILEASISPLPILFPKWDDLYVDCPKPEKKLQEYCDSLN